MYCSYQYLNVLFSSIPIDLPKKKFATLHKKKFATPTLKAKKKFATPTLTPTNRPNL